MDAPMFARTTRSSPRLWRAIGLLVAAGSFISPLAHANLGTAVEFYNASLNHYFITADPEQAAALDAGTPVKGWARTGGEFTVFTDPGAGRLEVCRFFGVLDAVHAPTTPPQASAQGDALPWTYEGIAFYIATPTNGDCRPTGRCTGASTATTSLTSTTASPRI
jgi:hypothetical protein